MERKYAKVRKWQVMGNNITIPIEHPLYPKRVAYSAARKLMRVGDGIGCRGGRPVSWIIRKWRGGAYDLSHWATIVRDIEIGASGRLEVFEFTGGEGGHTDYLSSRFEKEHGTVLWFPMNCTPHQQERIIECAADLEIEGVQYDYGTTWLAILRDTLPLDVTQFNCSESGWWLMTASGRLKRRYDKKGKEIAPVPGDFPVWADCSQVFELVMDS